MYFGYEKTCSIIVAVVECRFRSWGRKFREVWTVLHRSRWFLSIVLIMGSVRFWTKLTLPGDDSNSPARLPAVRPRRFISCWVIKNRLHGHSHCGYCPVRKSKCLAIIVSPLCGRLKVMSLSRKSPIFMLPLCDHSWRSIGIITPKKRNWKPSIGTRIRLGKNVRRCENKSML